MNGSDYQDDEYDENSDQNHEDHGEVEVENKYGPEQPDKNEREEEGPQEEERVLILEPDADEATSMLDQMNAMRLDCVMVDVTFQVKDKRFAAHRLVMSCCSRWLAALLYQHKNEDVVRLDELDPRAFESVMAHTYGETLEVRGDP